MDIKEFSRVFKAWTNYTYKRGTRKTWYGRTVETIRVPKTLTIGLRSGSEYVITADESHDWILNTDTCVLYTETEDQRISVDIDSVEDVSIEYRVDKLLTKLLDVKDDIP